MKEFIKSVFNILKFWKNFILFLGLGVLAVYVTVKFVVFVINEELNFKSLYEPIALSLVIFILSFVVAKFFPERFINWDIGLMKKLIRREKLIDELIAFIIVVIFCSPLTSFFMSLGLALFIFSFIKPDVNLLWKEIFIDSETIYEFLGGVAILPFGILFHLLVGVILPWVIIKKILKKENLSKYVVPIWFFTYLMLLEILEIFEDSILIQKIGDVISIISSKLAKFIIGALPLGWFYELFIGSIAREKEDI